MTAALASAPAATLDWRPHAGHRAAPLTIPASGKTGFTEMAPPVTGIRFTNRLAEERSLTNQIFLNGSGVAAGDIDGDGHCDLYFCGLDSPNSLYRNLGNWRFEEITLAAGVACAEQASTGAALADLDGDGDLDLLVTGIARGIRLFLNNGQGRFQEATDEAGLRSAAGSGSIALADIDGDGRLDLYVVNYRNDTMRDILGIQFSVGVTNGVYHLLSVNGRPATAPDLVGRFTFDHAGGVLENGQADALFRNQGGNRFARVDWTQGAFLDEQGRPVSTPYDWGLSAMFRDLNGDTAPDLYVCNDFQSPDRIWINDGQGVFRAIAPDSIRQTSLFSMGVDFADIDRDGNDDIFVADMLSRDHVRRQVQVMDSAAFAQFRNTGGPRPQFPRNTLFRNRGGGAFVELAQFSGLDASDWSWCPAFLDIDLDGYEDLLITTGHWRDAQNADIAREIEEVKRQKPMPAREQLRLARRFPQLRTPNVAFRNRGDLTFEETGAAWGFDSIRISHGLALADLDADGDLDVIVNCLDDGPLLLRNETPRPRIAVRLRGQAPNTRGVGARVRVRAPGLPPQSQEIIAGGRYLSSDDGTRTFAASPGLDPAIIEVIWRNGRRSLLTNAPANHLFEIDEALSRPRPFASGKDPAPSPAAYFADVSQLLGHEHVDEPFDDFIRQPLLPRKLSQLGPGVAWFDFNGDGWDDLFIGTGRGGRLAVFRNNAQGGFVRQRARPLETPADRDLTSVLGWRPSATNIVLLMGLAHYEDGATNAPAVRQFSVVTGAMDENLLRSPASTGPLAMADWDGDGDLDLFVGGRVQAGRYPESVSSVLLRNDHGRLRHDLETSRPLAGIGLVSGALFTDLELDCDPDLVLACDWGPIRIFRNEAGRFAAWDAPIRWVNPVAPGEGGLVPSELRAGSSTLKSLTGWWNSIAAGDFDGDGRLDLVAGNWGRNNARRGFLSEPLRLYFGDPGAGGHLALIEARYDSALRKFVPARHRDDVIAAFPWLANRFPSFSAFGAAGVDDLLAAGLPPMRQVAAATLDSVLLLNRVDHFEVRPLPLEAQLAPVFGIAVGDLDGDGTEDLFLAQNFFGVAVSESRQDAGAGLWLRGDGRGGFRAVSQPESGFGSYGEGRGAALSDFDHDGRLDLVVGQNRGPTQLYRNIRARPGLRIHLDGSNENPQAVGAVVRLVYRHGTFGPAREIRFGGGYWSQDSSDLIAGFREEPAAVEIRWPGGTREQVSLAAGARTLTRRMPGQLK